MRLPSLPEGPERGRHSDSQRDGETERSLTSLDFRLELWFRLALGYAQVIFRVSITLGVRVRVSVRIRLLGRVRVWLGTRLFYI